MIRAKLGLGARADTSNGAEAKPSSTEVWEMWHYWTAADAARLFYFRLQNIVYHISVVNNTALTEVTNCRYIFKQNLDNVFSTPKFATKLWNSQHSFFSRRKPTYYQLRINVSIPNEILKKKMLNRQSHNTQQVYFDKIFVCNCYSQITVSPNFYRER